MTSIKRMFIVSLTALLAVASFVSAKEPAASEGPKLVGAKKIMPLTKEMDIRENKGMHSMRLSPDGKHLLYVRGREGQRRAYEFVLRDIASRRDTVLPVAANDEDGYVVMLMSMRMFDAAGKRILLPLGQTVDSSGVLDLGKDAMQVGLYDIASAKLTRLDVKDTVVFQTFDSDGKGLIVMKMKGDPTDGGQMIVTPADKLTPKQLNTWGFIRSVCPTAPVMPMVILRKGRAATRPSFQRMPLVLYDIKADKQIAALPVHPRNSKLDDYNPQWTADGRYLYYVDYEPDLDDASKRGQMVARIWDRKKAKVVEAVGDCIPLGSGPGKTTMVLVKRDSSVPAKARIIVHTPGGGEWLLGDGTQRSISTEGKYLIYVKEDADGSQSVYMAEISMPVSATTQTGIGAHWRTLAHIGAHWRTLARIGAHWCNID